MVQAPYPVLIADQTVDLKPGHKYTIYGPAPAVTNNQVPSAQTGATINLRVRKDGSWISKDTNYLSVFTVDGDVYDKVRLNNSQSSSVLYIYDGILVTRRSSLVQPVTGDSFAALVAASTSLTGRAIIDAPLNGLTPLYLIYNLSVQTVGAVTGGFYIALVNNNPAGENGRSIHCTEGSVSGMTLINGNQSWAINYVNPDSVAHFMSANFFFMYGELP